MNDLFHIITGITALLSPWLLYLYKSQQDCITELQEKVSKSVTDIAVLRSETNNLLNTLENLSEKIDTCNDKLGEVLTFKPLLQNALDSIKEIRSPRP